MSGATMLASTCPLYSRSPPAGFLADYSALPIYGASPMLQRRPPSRLLAQRSAPCLPTQKTIQLYLGKATPTRPCLILRSDVDTNAFKCKKRVVFADDHGLELAQVRVMTEPSHVPPYWTLKVISATSSPPNGLAKKDNPAPAEIDHWDALFAQPASDYIEFRRRITEENVSLENVIIKEADSVLDGTVKVKNLDFHKEVFVRSTADGWRSHEDTYCAFSDSGPPLTNGCSSITSLYDTFSFRLQLPVHSRRLEFCVAFRCQETEFWDSNGGKNYVVERRSVRNTSAHAPVSSYCGRVNSGNAWSARSDATNDTPYW